MEAMLLNPGWKDSKCTYQNVQSTLRENFRKNCAEAHVKNVGMGGQNPMIYIFSNITRL
jgi:hypothetical protein